MEIMSIELPAGAGTISEINDKPIVITRIVWDTLFVDAQTITLFPLIGDPFSVMNPTGHYQTPKDCFFTRIDIPSTIRSGILSFEYQLQDEENLEKTKLDQMVNQYQVSDVMSFSHDRESQQVLPIPSNWKLNKYIEIIFIPQDIPEDATTDNQDYVYGNNTLGFFYCQDGQSRVFYNQQGNDTGGYNMEWSIGRKITAYYRVSYTIEEESGGGGDKCYYLIGY